MKNWKRALALLLSLVMALSLCACKNDGADASASPSADPSGSAEPSASPAIEVDLTQDALSFAANMSAGDTLLTVNGVEVKADLMLYWLALSCNNFMSMYGMMGIQLTDDAGNGSTYADQMRASAVTIAAYNMLLQQKAAELGCLPTDAQVQEAKDSMASSDAETLKTAFGLTDDSLDFLFLADAYYQNVLEAMVPTVTDEMLNSYAYQAKHILLKTVDTDAESVLQDDGTYGYPALPAEVVAEKKKQAEDILAQIQAADDPTAKFDELMNEFSEDGRDKDGALAAPDGYTTTLGQMVPGFEQGALALKPGEISGIVESSFGYHIILRGEVADLQSYAEDYRQNQVDQELGVMLEAAQTTQAPALDSLDVAAFFERYIAYQNAVVAQNQPTETDPVGPVESSGVG